MLIALFLLTTAVCGTETEEGVPFSWKHESSGNKLRISVQIVKNAYLYKDRTKVAVTDSTGKSAIPVKEPETVTEKDPFNEEHVIYPEGAAAWEFNLEGLIPPVKADISFQGCAKTPFVCYPPQKTVIAVSSRGTATVAPVEPSTPPLAKLSHSLEWKKQVTGFCIAGSAAGYMGEKDFIAFIDSATSATSKKEDSLFDRLKKNNMLVSILLILFGGLALNLTPCVLPMIPVNIAIIGAGAGSGSKLRGFTIGLMYGLGITLVYGLLGLLSILTGSTFGSINSMPYFNFAASVLFIILGLAMFDVFSIDFSKFLSAGKTNAKGDLLTAMGMGGISALLAGACVAPVVIAVLLFSSYLYSQGDVYGLVLPFILGAGMAIPWPFAGAGIAMLPKPGAWMVKVKYVFGVFIFAVAAYYLFAGYNLLTPARKADTVQAEGWMTSLPEAFATASKENRPLLIDFTASWCKNCEAMDHTTLKSPKVVEKLKDFVKLKFAAENPNDPSVKEILYYFKVLGMPTYVVLRQVNGQ